MTGQKKPQSGKPPVKTKDQVLPTNPQSTEVDPTLREDERVESLNDGQRDCLRLVNENRTSKDIARVLDVSPHTVDMRLRLAMRTLGVQTRGDAARTFAKYDIVGTSSEQPVQEATTSGSKTLREPSPTPILTDKQNRNVRVPWGKTNSLTSAERIGWVTAIMVGSGLSFAGLVAVLKGLKQAIY